MILNRVRGLNGLRGLRNWGLYGLRGHGMMRNHSKNIYNIPGNTSPTVAHHLNTAKRNMSTTISTSKACCTIERFIRILCRIRQDLCHRPQEQRERYHLRLRYLWVNFLSYFNCIPSNLRNNRDALTNTDYLIRFFPQTQQGADIIACSLNTRVFMPDFFAPDSSFPLSRFPAKTEEDKELLQTFFTTTANPPKTIAKLKTLGEALKAAGAKQIGVYGFCWGRAVAVYPVILSIYI
jgi:hypothetical protein